MTFHKLTKETEMTVMSTIEKIIDNSRHMPDADLNKIAADVFKETDGLTPELCRRACEAYNKSKSVHTLQKRACDDRAESFSLIDSDAVIADIYGYHTKVAIAKLDLNIPTLQDNALKAQQTGIVKIASDEELATLTPDTRVTERAIHRAVVDIEKSMDRFHAKVANHRHSSEEATHRVCQIMRRLPTKRMQKVARLAINRYGDDGVRFMKVIGAHTSSEFNLQKTAAAAIFPLEEPYTSVSIAIDEARAYNHYNQFLKKVAKTPSTWEMLKGNLGDKAREKVINSPSSFAGGIAETGRGAVGAVKGATSKLLDPILNFAKTPVFQQLTKDKDIGRDETFDSDMRNQLNQLRTTQGFIDVASDDFSKDYPIDDTMKAYNNVVGSMPELIDPKYAAWTRALVREQLVQGNVYDSATIKQDRKSVV